LPKGREGEYVSRRIDLTDPEEVVERLLNARKGAALGAKVGSIVPLGGQAVGATLGAFGGFILGDQTTVFPIDMIAIPAYQAYMLNGTPAFQIYIKEGEVLTQVQPTDAMVTEEMIEKSPDQQKSTKKKRKKGAGLPKKYAKMGFKKGWAAYNKTPARKKKIAAKKKKTRRKKK
tara:strand:- start:2147 stop:2668 length:522 start_codon:yes stop_codon:yes gene_type:complete